MEYYDDTDFLNAWNIAWDHDVAVTFGWGDDPKSRNPYCTIAVWYAKERKFCVAAGLTFMEAVTAALDELCLLKDHIIVYD